mmetsp:Transcript_30920/g.100673  ORF Transcript_30920/g.100673 Transcript_30920/m.100673 type:complete len:303 (+) Transcript_30920:553-1461(+)
MRKLFGPLFQKRAQAFEIDRLLNGALLAFAHAELEEALGVRERARALDRGAVAEGEARGGALHAQVLVRRQRAKVVLLWELALELLTQRIHLDPGSPDAEAVRHALHRIGGDVFDDEFRRGDFLDSRIELEIDGGLFEEVLRGPFRDAGVVGGEDEILEVDDDDARELLQPLREELREVLLDHVLELGGELDTRGTAPNHDEPEQLLCSLVADARHRRELEPRKHFFAEAPHVIELLKKQTILLHPRDPERLRLCAHGEHERVVIDDKLALLARDCVPRPRLARRRFRGHLGHHRLLLRVDL